MVAESGARPVTYAKICFLVLQQSKQVRRIGQDDAAAASHTVAAVLGDLPLSSATAGADRATSARPQSTTNADAAASKPMVQSKAASQAVKPKPLPAVTIKARAPQVVVKAKRKADDAAQTDQPPDKKQTPDESLKPQDPATDQGLVGLAAYGSDSGDSGGGVV